MQAKLKLRPSRPWRHARAALVGGIVAAGFLLLAVPAFANTKACGEWGYYGPIETYNYQNLSCIHYQSAAGAESYGNITVETQYGANVPTGWMGAHPRVFTSSGALCIQTGWDYNGSPASGLVVSAYRPAYYCGAGYFYSSGESRAWNGSGYDTYSSFRSPNLYIP